MHNIREITGIILAGGESKRMGKDKSKILYNEKPLIEYPVDLFLKFCKEIIISSDNDKYSEYDFLKVADEAERNGPLSGIYSCLKASKNFFNLVTSCDMPFLTKELIEYIIDNSDDYDLIMPFHNSHFEPLCAVYSKNLIPVIENLFSKKDYSPLSLIPLVNFKKLTLDESMDFYNKKLFFNINTPEDIENLQ